MAAPRVQAVPPKPLPSEARLIKKERFLTCLNKMNDRDTQKRAAEELMELISDKAWLDADALSMAVHALSTSSAGQKVFARKEVARVMGAFGKDTCPLRDTALSPQYLPKILAQLKRALQDADTVVREAAAEALAAVAQGLSESGAAQGGGTVSTHPIGRTLIECLSDGKRELQASAALALGLAAPYLGTVEPSLAKDLIRRLTAASSGGFHAQAALLAAIARCDPLSNAPQGLLKSSPGAFQQHMSSLVGQPPSVSAAGTGGLGSPTAASQGSGLCGCLGSKDWMTRRAAADCVRAAALALGPLLEPDGAWDPANPASLTTRLLRALEQPKFDKVKEVRESAREAAALLEDLRQYAQGGGSTPGWSGAAAESMAARGHTLAPDGTAVPPARPASAAAAGGLSPQPSSAAVASPAAGGHHSPAAERAALMRPLSPPRHRPASPPHLLPMRPVSPPKDRVPPFQRHGSLADRFKAAHEEQDVIMDAAGRVKPIGQGAPGSRPASGQQQQQGSRQPSLRRSGSGNAGQAESQDRDLDITLLDRLPAPGPPPRTASGRSRPASGSSAGSRPPSARAAAAAADATPQEQTVILKMSEWRTVQRQMQELKEANEVLEGRNQELESALASSTHTIQDLKRRLAIAEAAAVAVAHGHAYRNSGGALLQGVHPDVSHMHQQHHNQGGDVGADDHSDTHSDGAVHGISSREATLAAGGQLHRADPAELNATLTLSPQLLQQHSLSDPEPSSEPVFLFTRKSVSSAGGGSATGGPAAGTPQADTSKEPAGGAAEAGREMNPRASVGNLGAPLVRPVSPPRSSIALLQTPEDLNAAFADALANDRGELHMLHLLGAAGAGPWADLEAPVAHKLLDAFANLVQDRIMQPRVLPWLWRLADDTAAPHLQSGVPLETQARLMAGIRAAAAAAEGAGDVQAAEKLQLLYATLQAHWAMGGSSPTRGSPGSRPTSAAGPAAATLTQSTAARSLSPTRALSTSLLARPTSPPPALFPTRAVSMAVRPTSPSSIASAAAAAVAASSGGSPLRLSHPPSLSGGAPSRSNSGALGIAGGLGGAVVPPLRPLSAQGLQALRSLQQQLLNPALPLAPSLSHPTPAAVSAAGVPGAALAPTLTTVTAGGQQVHQRPLSAGGLGYSSSSGRVSGTGGIAGGPGLGAGGHGHPSSSVSGPLGLGLVGGHVRSMLPSEIRAAAAAEAAAAVQYQRRLAQQQLSGSSVGEGGGTSGGGAAVSAGPGAASVSAGQTRESAGAAAGAPSALHRQGSTAGAAAAAGSGRQLLPALQPREPQGTAPPPAGGSSSRPFSANPGTGVGANPTGVPTQPQPEDSSGSSAPLAATFGRNSLLAPSRGWGGAAVGQVSESKLRPQSALVVPSSQQQQSQQQGGSSSGRVKSAGIARDPASSSQVLLRPPPDLDPTANGVTGIDDSSRVSTPQLFKGPQTRPLSPPGLGPALSPPGTPTASGHGARDGVSSPTPRLQGEPMARAGSAGSSTGATGRGPPSLPLGGSPAPGSEQQAQQVPAGAGSNTTSPPGQQPLSRAPSTRKPGKAGGVGGSRAQRAASSAALSGRLSPAAAAEAVQGGTPPPGGLASPYRQSLENLDVLKQELEHLEREFQQSPAFKQARMLTAAAQQRAANVAPPIVAAADGTVLPSTTTDTSPPGSVGGGVSRGASRGPSSSEVIALPPSQLASRSNTPDRATLAARAEEVLAEASNRVALQQAAAEKAGQQGQAAGSSSGRLASAGGSADIAETKGSAPGAATTSQAGGDGAGDVPAHADVDQTGVNPASRVAAPEASEIKGSAEDGTTPLPPETAATPAEAAATPGAKAGAAATSSATPAAPGATKDISTRPAEPAAKAQAAETSAAPSPPPAAGPDVPPTAGGKLSTTIAEGAAQPGKPAVSAPAGAQVPPAAGLPVGEAQATTPPGQADAYTTAGTLSAPGSTSNPSLPLPLSKEQSSHEAPQQGKEAADPTPLLPPKDTSQQASHGGDSAAATWPSAAVAPPLLPRAASEPTTSNDENASAGHAGAKQAEGGLPKRSGATAPPPAGAPAPDAASPDAPTTHAVLTPATQLPTPPASQDAIDPQAGGHPTGSAAPAAPDTGSDASPPAPASPVITPADTSAQPMPVVPLPAATEPAAQAPAAGHVPHAALSLTPLEQQTPTTEAGAAPPAHATAEISKAEGADSSPQQSV